MITIYRNYSNDYTDILSSTPFESKPEAVKAFLKNVRPKGGQGN